MKIPPILEEMNEETFQQWRHHPVTAAFLEFLGDQAMNFREVAMDLWEDGLLDPNSPNPQINANMVRGRVLTLRELQTVALEDIKTFYSQGDQEKA